MTTLLTSIIQEHTCEIILFIYFQLCIQTCLHALAKIGIFGLITIMLLNLLNTIDYLFLNVTSLPEELCVINKIFVSV